MADRKKENAIIQAKFNSEQFVARSIEQHYTKLQTDLFLWGAFWSIAALLFFEANTD